VGNGRLQIIEGRYRIPNRFGLTNDLMAPLNITRGQPVWVMNPIRNPGLLFLAQRGTGRTVANVPVGGTLADPRFTFFSDKDPATTQTEATTFVLTGIRPRPHILAGLPQGGTTPAQRARGVRCGETSMSAGCASRRRSAPTQDRFALGFASSRGCRSRAAGFGYRL
jgi:hypothetical protein